MSTHTEKPVSGCKSGKPLPIMIEEERRKFEARVMPEPNTGCHLWIGPVHRTGYGTFSLRNRNTLPHRVAWVQRHGQVPEGMVIRHRCDERSCVNVDHLEAGSQSDNIQDAKSRGRQFIHDGHRNGNSKLTIEGAKLVLSLRGRMSQRAAALAVGISASQIANIWSGRQWRFLSEDRANG